MSTDITTTQISKDVPKSSVVPEVNTNQANAARQNAVVEDGKSLPPVEIVEAKPEKNCRKRWHNLINIYSRFNAICCLVSMTVVAEPLYRWLIRKQMKSFDKYRPKMCYVSCVIYRSKWIVHQV